MVAAPPPPTPARSWRTGSWIDDRWAGLPPRARTILRWSAPAGIMLTAALTRLVGIDQPHEIVFDETYYVKDAWTTWVNGYESTWQTKPGDDGWTNEQFASGNVDIFTDQGEFAVHPPLGKWLIALGMAAFGPADSYGWRFSVAIAGILLVGLVMLVAHRLTRSMLVAAFAGGLLAIDGNGIVMSRIGLLDGFVALFALLGFWFVLLDRERTLRTGALWARPWLLAAGAALGAASAVKWNGVWFIVFFGIWTVFSDVWASRNGWELLRRIPVNFLLLVPVALVVYLASWAGWFATDNGYYRHWADQGDHAWTGFWAWVPHSIQSFVHQQQEVLRFHENLRADHPYKSQAWAWLLLVRPTSFYYVSSNAGDPGCGADSCGAAITDIPNPLIWYASIAALVWLVVVVSRRRASWAKAPAIAVLIGFAAGWAPWLLQWERPTYFFYSIAYQPFLVIALAMALRAFLGAREDERSRRTTRTWLVVGFLVLCTALSVFYWPMWTGMTVPYDFLRLHWWVPSWI